MKNVTINLGESPHKWARVEAAKAGKSLSSWLANHLIKAQGTRNDQREALRRLLAAPDFPGLTANRPTREELYAERVFRRYERDFVPEGSGGSLKTRTSARVARRAR